MSSECIRSSSRGKHKKSQEIDLIEDILNDRDYYESSDESFSPVDSSRDASITKIENPQVTLEAGEIIDILSHNEKLSTETGRKSEQERSDENIVKKDISESKTQVPALESSENKKVYLNDDSSVEVLDLTIENEEVKTLVKPIKHEGHHLIFKNIDNSFTIEALTKIFNEEFTKNKQFKIKLIEFTGENDSFTVMLQFEELENAVDVYLNKIMYSLPFKNKLNRVEPGDLLKSYLQTLSKAELRKKRFDVGSAESKPYSNLTSKENKDLYLPPSSLNNSNTRNSLDNKKANSKFSRNGFEEKNHIRSRSSSRRSSSKSRRSRSRSTSRKREIHNPKFKRVSGFDKKPSPETINGGFINRTQPFRERRSNFDIKSYDSNSDGSTKFFRPNRMADERQSQFSFPVQPAITNPFFPNPLPNNNVRTNIELSQNRFKPSNFTSTTITEKIQNIHLKSCYLLGIPANVDTAEISNEILKRTREVPEKIVKSKKNSYKDEIREVIYYYLVFNSKQTVDYLLDKGFEIQGNSVLVLPSLENKTIEEMVVFHQISVTSVDASINRIDLRNELTNLYRFFAGFGKIVDFNLEYFPHYIYITFAKHESVRQLINIENIIYSSPTHHEYRLRVRKLEKGLSVRNLKDSKESKYVNYMPSFLRVSKI